MSFLHVFRRRPWLRRLSLVFVGLLLGTLYHYRLLTDYYIEPFLFSLILGFFSINLFRAFINYIVILISMVAALLTMVLASNLGANAPIDLNVYMAVIARALEASAIPLLVWIPGIPAGHYIRHLTLDRV